MAFSGKALAQAAAAGADARLPRAVGYLPWWIARAWPSIDLEPLDRVLLFDAPVEADGAIADRQWPSLVPGLLDLAQRRRLPIDVVVSVLDRGRLEVFRAPESRQRLLANALALLREPYVSGLHIDVEAFEDVDPAVVAGFRNWLQALDHHRRGAGKGLSAFFPASDRFEPYDPASAGRMDYWVAQLYDAHWKGSETSGPIVTRREANPVAVPRALARLQRAGIRREATLLSIPLYGIEWSTEQEHPGARTLGEGRLLTYAGTPAELMPNDRLVAMDLARRHGLRRDGERTPHYAYRDGSRWVQGWFEDAESLAYKIASERTAGYGGLAFFALGYDSGEVVRRMLEWWRAAAR